MKKIVHIITSLNQGGAEMMLLKLLQVLSKHDEYELHVISLMAPGQLSSTVESLGVRVHYLNIMRDSGFFRSLRQGLCICRNVHVIQTWMYHGDLFGFVMKLFNLQAQLIWGVRQSNLDWSLNTPRTLLIARLNGVLSHTPLVNCIVTNSEKAAETHSAIGYAENKFRVIPNGFDLSLYGKGQRELARRIIGISEDTFVIATVGRWDPQKGYSTLFEGFRKSALYGTGARLLMIGTGLESNNSVLLDCIRFNGLEEQVVLLGARNDVPRILSAADIYISSSYGEGFSNAIGEAMATGLPCIVTDAGDSRLIIGDSGWLVPSKSSEALGHALSDIFALSEDQLRLKGLQARERIDACYGIDRIVRQYQQLYEK